MTVLTVLLLGAVALGASAVHAVAGFGSGPLLVPALLLVFAPPAAVVAAVLLGMTVNVLQLAAERRRPQLQLRPLASLWAAAVPGVVGGALLASALDRHAASVAVAAALLPCAVAVLLRPMSLPRGALPAGGALAGLSAALTGIFGPLLGLLLLSTGRHGDSLRDAIGTSFLVVGACAVIATLAISPSWTGPAIGAALVVPAVAGHAVGRRVAGRLSRPAQRLALVMTVVAASAIALAGALG